MQRLHHSRSLFFARVVGGGGNQGKRIVEVNQLGPLFSQDRTQLPRSIPGPKRPNPCFHVLQDAVVRHFHILPNVFHNLVAGRAKQRSLAGEDDIFAARRAVAVVGNEQLHKASGWGRAVTPIGKLS